MSLNLPEAIQMKHVITVLGLEALIKRALLWGIAWQW